MKMRGKEKGLVHKFLRMSEGYFLNLKIQRILRPLYGKALSRNLKFGLTKDR